MSLLDTACARVAVSQHATPATVDDARKRIAGLETELEIIGREPMPVRVHHENVRYLRTKRDRMGHLLEELDQIAEGQL